MLPPLLDVRRLTVSYPNPSGPIRVVRDFSLQISQGETLALVGETGCGKTTVALSLLGLLSFEQQIESGEIYFEGQNLQALDSRAWRRIRGLKIGMVFQQPRTYLNPVLTLESHLREALRAHRNLSTREARVRVLELLAEVGFQDPAAHLRDYPSQLSGGMCQRLGIALGICHQPSLLIADEPTSALDSTIQAQILNLLQEMKRRYSLSLILISHNLAMVAEFADRVAVMYHGRLVEVGRTEELLSRPRHPYTLAIRESVPDLAHRRDRAPLRPIPGRPPRAGEDLPGCAFAPRCAIADAKCTQAIPPPVVFSESHWAACIKAQ